MSSIDSSDNLGLASFALSENYSVPVYWVFGDHPYEHDEYSHMVANGNQLCFGGGSGEHPCLMISVADAMLWLVSHIGDDVNFNLLDIVESQPEEYALFENIVDQVCGWQGESLKDILDEFYYGKPSFVIDMWPLHAWTSLANYYSRKLNVPQARFSFSSFMTIASIVTLELYPWQYCTDARLVAAYKKMRALIDQAKGADISVAGKDFGVTELTQLVMSAIQTTGAYRSFGRILVRKPDRELQVVWNCSLAELDRYYSIYQQDPNNSEVPPGLLRHFAARQAQETR